MPFALIVSGFVRPTVAAGVRWVLALSLPGRAPPGAEALPPGIKWGKPLNPTGCLFLSCISKYPPCGLFPLSFDLTIPTQYIDSATRVKHYILCRNLLQRIQRKKLSVIPPHCLPYYLLCPLKKYGVYLAPSPAVRDIKSALCI